MSSPSPAAKNGCQMGCLERVLCVLIVAILIAIVVPPLTRKKEASRAAGCQNNLKQLGLSFRMYASDSDGQYPALAPQKGLITFANDQQDQHAIYPNYLTDFCVLQCPAASDALPKQTVHDDSYIYLGYVITTDAELETFARAYRERVASGLRFDTDLEVAPGTATAGGGKILRLHEGVERILITDSSKPDAVRLAQSVIPVMWDRCHYDPNKPTQEWFSDPRCGANVLYMDGHVEFVKYPGKFPLTETACRILNALHDTNTATDASPEAKP